MSASRGGLRYLFWCANEHLDFRIPEFESLAKIFGIRLDWVEKNDRRPWVILDLPSEAQARQIVSRSISTRYCVELWGDGSSTEELHKSVKGFCRDREDLVSPHRHKSFKVYVEAFMKKFTLEERLEKIETFSYLPTDGPVRLKDPELTLCCFEFYGFDHNNLPSAPERCFFGRCVGEGRRSLVTRLSLKSRRFIGNTTMDPQLSLLMANLGGVREGDLALDPFVGTGSLTLACAQFGARVLGSDIDFLMLHARTRPSRKGQKRRAVDESVRANFEQVGLDSNYVDVVVCDAANPPWREKGIFKVNFEILYRC